MPLAASYNTVGNREDLTDIIEMVDPEVTPMYSRFPKSKAPKGVYHEWQTDSRKNPNITGTIDGTDQNDFRNQAENRLRLGNRVQEFREAYMVSRLQEMVETAGVPSEFGRSKAKATVDIKIDIESAIGSDNEMRAGSGTEDARLRALGKWIDPTNTDIDPMVRTPASSVETTSTVDEDKFDAVLQSSYEQSGDTANFALYCGTALKRKVTEFSKYASATAPIVALNRTNENASAKKITRSVMAYDGDWGLVALIPDLFLARTDGGDLTDEGRQRGYLIPDGRAKLAFMQQPSAEEFPDLGGGKRGMVSAFLTLCLTNPKDCGKFAG